MAGAELVFPAAPAFIGGARILPTPTQFFLTGEDRLRVVASNAVVGVTIRIQARVATFAGVIVPQSWDHTPASDRTVTTQDFELGTGSLLNLTVFAAAGSPRIGQTYVILQLVRGIGAAAIVMGTLVSGYVTRVQAIGFPGSPILSSIDSGGCIRSIAGTTPALGAEVIETVPTGARWQLLTVTVQLHTSAVAGARRPTLFFGNAVVDILPSGSVLDTAAGIFQTYFWSIDSWLIAVLGSAPPVSGLNSAHRLLAGHNFYTRTAGILAGDQWAQVFYMVQEWLEVF